MKISRRYFLKNGGVAMLGMAALPSFLQRAVAARLRPTRRKWSFSSSAARWTA